MLKVFQVINLHRLNRMKKNFFFYRDTYEVVAKVEREYMGA